VWTELPEPQVVAEEVNAYRYQPLAVLWNDGTMMRLKSPTRLVLTYRMGKVRQHDLDKLRAFLREHLDRIESEPTILVLDSDSRSLDITLDGRTVRQSWPLMDRRQHPLLEEVVDRLFSVRIEDARTIRVDWGDSAYSTR